MKKPYALKLFVASFVLLCQSFGSISQVTTLGNVNQAATDFLGWNNTVTIALNINHKANTAASDINFLTRNTQRMVLTDNGLLGLGSSTTAPFSMLHISRNTTSLGSLFRTDGLNTEINQWQLMS